LPDIKHLLSENMRYQRAETLNAYGGVFLIVIVNYTRGKEISATGAVQEIKRRGGNGRRDEDQGSAP
jgi:hypothetical protein